MGFKTLKERTKKCTAVKKGPSSFQNFYLILDKCNKITAESLENETVKCHPRWRRSFTDDIKLSRLLKKSKRKRRVFNRNQQSNRS